LVLELAVQEVLTMVHLGAVVAEVDILYLLLYN
jgi:hypothetical protein